MSDLVNSRFATVEGASQYCGLSRRSLWRLLARKELTAFRPIPGRVLIDLAELDALVRSGAGICGTRGRRKTKRP